MKLRDFHVTPMSGALVPAMACSYGQILIAPVSTHARLYTFFIAIFIVDPTRYIYNILLDSFLFHTHSITGHPYPFFLCTYTYFLT